MFSFRARPPNTQKYNRVSASKPASPGLIRTVAQPTAAGARKAIDQPTEIQVCPLCSKVNSTFLGVRASSSVKLLAPALEHGVPRDLNTPSATHWTISDTPSTFFPGLIPSSCHSCHIFVPQVFGGPFPFGSIFLSVLTNGEVHPTTLLPSASRGLCGFLRSTTSTTTFTSRRPTRFLGRQLHTQTRRKR